MKVGRKKGVKLAHYQLPPTKKLMVGALIVPDNKVKIIINEKAPWCGYDETVTLTFTAQELWDIAEWKIHQACKSL